MGANEDIAYAEKLGGVLIPAFIALCVGIYRLASIGSQWPAFVMIGGAIASWMAVAAFSRIAASPPGRSWPKAAGAASALLPWAFSLYLVGYEGFYRAYQGFTGAGTSSVVIGAFWVIAGWRMVYQLDKVTTLQVAA